MSAPSEARKVQVVKIHSMQSLTNSIEPTTAWQAVTNVVKLVEGTYQAATKVKVLSPVMFDIIEADVFHCAEGSTKGGVKVSHNLLYRGLSPWHDMRWNLRELGRSLIFLQGYAGTRQQSQELADDIREVGLTDSTLSIGKLCTRGSGQQWRAELNTCLRKTQSLLSKCLVKFNSTTKLIDLANASLRSRVWENHKHGSVGVAMLDKLTINVWRI